MIYKLSSATGTQDSKIVSEEDSMDENNVNYPDVSDMAGIQCPVFDT